MKKLLSLEKKTNSSVTVKSTEKKKESLDVSLGVGMEKKMMKLFQLVEVERVTGRNQFVLLTKNLDQQEGLRN